MGSFQDLDFTGLGHGTGKCLRPKLLGIVAADFKAGSVIYSAGNRFDGVYLVRCDITKMKFRCMVGSDSLPLLSLEMS